MDYRKKPTVQNIKNAFLRLMKWIGSARESDAVCKG